MALRREAVDPASRIDRLVAYHTPRVRRTFLMAVREIRNRRTLEQIAALLEAGNIEGALAGIEAAGAAIAGARGEALTSAGRSTAEFVSRSLDVRVYFDQVNWRAVEILQRSRLNLITEFTAQQRAATRSALTEGTRLGLNPRDQARMFRDSIGLTERQQQAVNNYRRLLTEGDREALARQLRDKRFDPTVRRSLSSGEPLTRQQIDRMTGRYAERYVRYRSEVIGRTEALRGVHEGVEEMYRQAIDAGELQQQELSRTWVTSRDERVRHSHADLDGVTVEFGEPFEAEGGSLMYPGDPSAPAEETVQCRCSVTTRMSPLDEN